MLTISIIGFLIGATELMIELLDNTATKRHDRNNSKSVSLRTSDRTTKGLQRTQHLSA